MKTWNDVNNQNNIFLWFRYRGINFLALQVLSSSGCRTLYYGVNVVGRTPINYYTTSLFSINNIYVLDHERFLHEPDWNSFYYSRDYIRVATEEESQQFIKEHDLKQKQDQPFILHPFNQEPTKEITMKPEIGKTYSENGNNWYWTCIENRTGKKFNNYGIEQSHDDVDSPIHPWVFVMWNLFNKEIFIDCLNEDFESPRRRFTVSSTTLEIHNIPTKVREVFEETLKNVKNNPNKKFVRFDGRLFCTDEKDNVCSYHFEEIPKEINHQRNVKIAGEKIEDFTYELYCKYYNIKPVYEKQKNPSELYEDFVSKVCKEKYGTSLGCQADNTILLLKDFRKMVFTLKTIPSPYRYAAASMISESLKTNWDLSTVETDFNGRAKPKFSEFRAEVVKLMSAIAFI